MGSASHMPKAEMAWLTRAGFVAVVPNYRLCPHVDVWAGPVQDCINFYNWIVLGKLQDGLDKHHIKIDVSKVVIFGHSTGATMAQFLVIASKPSNF
jgi:acetyl esterase/lipase